jgi:hypothetical protein
MKAAYDAPPVQLVEETYGTIGNGTLAVSGTGGLCLSGTVSLPCGKVILTTTASGLLVGSSTASGTLPLPANTALTISASNVNLIYLSGGTGNVGYLYQRW